MKMELKEYS